MHLSFQPPLFTFAATVFACISLRRKWGSAADRRALLLKHALWVYVCFVLSITMLPMFEFPLGRENTHINLNLQPFGIITNDWDIMLGGDRPGYTRAMATMNLLGNFVMLLPIGLLAGLVYPRFRKPLYCLLLGLLFSGCIELTQLLQTHLKIVGLRYCDIDDIILNTTGCMLGWVLQRLYLRRFRQAGI